MFDSIVEQARALKRQTMVAYYAARDPRTPWAVRLLALIIAAYALSPIDLIPDFIPVIGLLDDLVLVPLGVALVVRLVPHEVLVSARGKADVQTAKPVSVTAALMVVAIWLLMLWWCIEAFCSFSSTMSPCITTWYPSASASRVLDNLYM